MQLKWIICIKVITRTSRRAIKKLITIQIKMVRYIKAMIRKIILRIIIMIKKISQKNKENKNLNTKIQMMMMMMMMNIQLINVKMMKTIIILKMLTVMKTTTQIALIKFVQKAFAIAIMNATIMVIIFIFTIAMMIAMIKFMDKMISKNTLIVTFSITAMH